MKEKKKERTRENFPIQMEGGISINTSLTPPESPAAGTPLFFPSFGQKQ